MYVPWRRVASWHCSACGECCLKFKPKLTFYEYLKFRELGLERFVEERVGRYYIRKSGKCPFQTGRLCALQDSIKPLACRVFPFLVSRSRRDDEASIEVDGEEYWVYVSVECPNVVLGRAGREVERLARQAVELVTGKAGEWSITCTHPVQATRRNQAKTGKTRATRKLKF